MKELKLRIVFWFDELIKSLTNNKETYRSIGTDAYKLYSLNCELYYVCTSQYNKLITYLLTYLLTYLKQ